MYGEKIAHACGFGIGQQVMAAGSIGRIEERRPELAEYMERMAAAISMNEELANHLYKRLDYVLRPSMPTETASMQSAVGPSTYYGQQLQAGIDRIAAVNGRLQEMLHRLEA